MRHYNHIIDDRLRRCTYPSNLSTCFHGLMQNNVSPLDSSLSKPIGKEDFWIV